MIGDPAQPGFRPASARVKRRLPVPFGGGVSGTSCPLAPIGTSWAALLAKADRKIEHWSGRTGKNAASNLKFWEEKRAEYAANLACQYPAAPKPPPPTPTTAPSPTGPAVHYEAATMYAATGTGPPRLVIGGAVALVGLVVTVVLWQRFA